MIAIDWAKFIVAKFQKESLDGIKGTIISN